MSSHARYVLFSFAAMDVPPSSICEVAGQRSKALENLIAAITLELDYAWTHFRRSNDRTNISKALHIKIEGSSHAQSYLFSFAAMDVSPSSIHEGKQAAVAGTRVVPGFSSSLYATCWRQALCVVLESVFTIRFNSLPESSVKDASHHQALASSVVEGIDWQKGWRSFIESPFLFGSALSRTHVTSLLPYVPHSNYTMLVAYPKMQTKQGRQKPAAYLFISTVILFLCRCVRNLNSHLSHVTHYHRQSSTSTSTIFPGMMLFATYLSYNNCHHLLTQYCLLGIISASSV
eukprot:scaffold9402_cov90-Skeletonema_dohrnii-CCMP3373.AAC.3